MKICACGDIPEDIGWALHGSYLEVYGHCGCDWSIEVYLSGNTYSNEDLENPDFVYGLAWLVWESHPRANTAEKERLNSVRSLLLQWENFERGEDPIGVVHAAGYMAAVKDCTEAIGKIVNGNVN